MLHADSTFHASDSVDDEELVSREDKRLADLSPLLGARLIQKLAPGLSNETMTDRTDSSNNSEW